VEVSTALANKDFATVYKLATKTLDA